MIQNCEDGITISKHFKLGLVVFALILIYDSIFIKEDMVRAFIIINILSNYRTMIRFLTDFTTETIPVIPSTGLYPQQTIFPGVVQYAPNKETYNPIAEEPNESNIPLTKEKYNPPVNMVKDKEFVLSDEDDYYSINKKFENYLSNVFTDTTPFMLSNFS